MTNQEKWNSAAARIPAIVGSVDEGGIVAIHLWSHGHPMLHVHLEWPAFCERFHGREVSLDRYRRVSIKEDGIEWSSYEPMQHEPSQRTMPIRRLPEAAGATT